MFHSTLLFAAESAEKGGLFDLDATLPFMAIQFLILVAVLNAIFYKPVGEAIDSRQDFIRTTLAEARERTEKAKATAQQYQEAITQARQKAQQVIGDAEAAALKIRAQKVAEVQAEIQAKLESARLTIEQEKQAALQELEGQIGILSQQITQKLLGVSAHMG
ncbi:MAG: F0F1 ATP synthase subunit B' [Cyanobacteriota bacterium]|nr:F0F1 ATP synthase subunit B' [Cyanobacteriota bacterium]